MRSRARRWARVVDDATWPEVLRRYLLATRAMLPQPSPQELTSDVSCIDDDAAAVMAAMLLTERSFLRCACSCILLVTACASCTSQMHSCPSVLFIAGWCLTSPAAGIYFKCQTWHSLAPDQSILMVPFQAMPTKADNLP